MVAQQQHLLSQRIQPISINNLSTGVPQNVNILQARRGPQRVTRLPNGKRRIQPISLNPLNGSANPASTAAVSVTQTQTQILPPTPLKLNGSAADVFAAAVDQPLENQSRVNQLRDDMAQHTSTGYSEMTRSTTTFVTEQDDINGSADRADKRRRTSTDGDWEPQSRYIRGRTLGGGEKSTRDSQSQSVRELIPMMKSAGPLPSSSSSTAGGEPVVRLPLPIVQTLLRSSSEDDHLLVVEGENSDDGEHSFRVSTHNQEETRPNIDSTFRYTISSDHEPKRTDPVARLSSASHYRIGHFISRGLVWVARWLFDRVQSIRHSVSSLAFAW